MSKRTTSRPPSKVATSTQDGPEEGGDGFLRVRLSASGIEVLGLLQLLGLQALALRLRRVPPRQHSLSPPHPHMHTQSHTDIDTCGGVRSGPISSAHTHQNIHCKAASTESALDSVRGEGARHAAGPDEVEVRPEVQVGVRMIAVIVNVSNWGVFVWVMPIRG